MTKAGIDWCKLSRSKMESYICSIILEYSDGLSAEPWYWEHIVILEALDEDDARERCLKDGIPPGSLTFETALGRTATGRVLGIADADPVNIDEWVGEGLILVRPISKVVAFGLIAGPFEMNSAIV